MPKSNNRHVVRDDDGGWDVRVSAVTDIPG